MHVQNHLCTVVLFPLSVILSIVDSIGAATIVVYLGISLHDLLCDVLRPPIICGCVHVWLCKLVLAKKAK